MNNFAVIIRIMDLQACFIVTILLNFAKPISSSNCFSFVPGENCGLKNPIKMRNAFNPDEIQKGCICITVEKAADEYNAYGNY